MYVHAPESFCASCRAIPNANVQGEDEMTDREHDKKSRSILPCRYVIQRRSSSNLSGHDHSPYEHTETTKAQANKPKRISYVLGVFLPEILTYVECGIEDSIYQFFTQGRVTADQNDVDVRAVPPPQFTLDELAKFGIQFDASATRLAVRSAMLDKLRALCDHYGHRMGNANPGVCETFAHMLPPLGDGNKRLALVYTSLAHLKDSTKEQIMIPGRLTYLLDLYVPVIVAHITVGVEDALHAFFSGNLGAVTPESIALPRLMWISKDPSIKPVPFDLDMVRDMARNVMTCKLITLFGAMHTATALGSG